MHLGVIEAIRNNFAAGDYKIRILTGSLFAAIVADGVITMSLVHSGLAREGNPFMEYWVAEDKLLFIKICGGILVAICLWSIYRRLPRLTIAFTSIMLTAYIFIICWNLFILF